MTTMKEIKYWGRLTIKVEQLADVESDDVYEDVWQAEIETVDRRYPVIVQGWSNTYNGAIETASEKLRMTYKELMEFYK